MRFISRALSSLLLLTLSLIFLPVIADLLISYSDSDSDSEDERRFEEEDLRFCEAGHWLVGQTSLAPLKNQPPCLVPCPYLYPASATFDPCGPGPFLASDSVSYPSNPRSPSPNPNPMTLTEICGVDDP